MIKSPQFCTDIKYSWPEYYQKNSIIFVCFLGFVIYWYLQGGYRFPILGTIRFEFFTGFILVIFGAHTYFLNPNKKRSGMGLWTSLLIITLVTMVIFSYVPKISYDIFIDRVIKMALFGFFIAAFVTTPKRLSLFIGAFLLACFKMGQEGLLGVITGSLMWENQGVMRLHGSTPMYQHPNSLTGMALGTLPFIFYFYKIAPWYLRWALMILLLLMINIIIYTGSRTGYVGFFIGILYLCWKSQNPKRAFLVLVLISGISFPLIPSDYLERAGTIFTQKDKEGASTEARKEILADAWKIFLMNPLGVGVHAFPTVRNMYFGRTQDTHNLYLEIATNLGIQGLAIFTGFIIALLRTLARITKSLTHQIEWIEEALSKPLPEDINIKDYQNHLHDLLIMKMASQAVFAFIIIRLSLGFFGMDLYEIYWWFALGTTIAIWNLNTVAKNRSINFCKCFDEKLVMTH